MLFPETTTDLSSGDLKGLRIFFSELNLELIIDDKLVRLSSCNIGLLIMRPILAPLSNLSRSLMSWLMIICCWKTSWCAIAALYCSFMCCIYSILTSEQQRCVAYCVYMKWRTTKHKTTHRRIHATHPGELGKCVNYGDFWTKVIENWLHNVKYNER